MFRNRKLERRIASLEKVLGVDWYEYSEEHHVYFSLNTGALHSLFNKVNVTHRYTLTTLKYLLDYFNLTVVTTPEKTVIEPVKKKEEKNA